MSTMDAQLFPVEEFSRTINELTAFIGIPEASVDLRFTGVTLDSRAVRSGDLFIALQGVKSHGAEYAQEVMNRGASAILTDQAGAKQISDSLPVIVVDDPRAWVGAIASWFYRNPFSALAAVGITGTNGKTTTAALVDQIWRLDGRSSGFIGTIGIAIDGEEHATAFTTPEGTDLQAILATMRERHLRNVVMEVSSHALSMGRIRGAHFKVVGFTNLTQDHLDFHGNMENYFLAKKKLFTFEYADTALVNLDDSYGQRLIDQATIATKSYSRSQSHADWYYQSYTVSESGLGFDVAIRGSGGVLIEGHLPLLGLHNLDNALLAIALAVESGVDPIAIAYYMPKLAAPVGRLQPVDLGQKFLALVDYAHTPDAVTRALECVRAITTGKVIAVLGCGGDRDKGKRPIMGEALRAGSDIAVFTSDNPRSENPLQILKEMVGENFGDDQPADHQIVEPDRRIAIAKAVLIAEPGDCVIILGKGHERGQEINGIKFPFDDRIELARAIEELA